MKPLPPCKNCQRRTETCHAKGNCLAYDKFLVEYNDWVNLQKAEKDTDSAYRGCVINWRNIALRAKR